MALVKLSSRLWYCGVKVYCGYKYFYSENNTEFWESFFWFWKLGPLLPVQTWCRGWLHKGNGVNRQHEAWLLDLGSHLEVFCIRCSSLSSGSWKWWWEMSGCASGAKMKPWWWGWAVGHWMCAGHCQKFPSRWREAAMAATKGHAAQPSNKDHWENITIEA